MADWRRLRGASTLHKLNDGSFQMVAEPDR